MRILLILVFIGTLGAQQQKENNDYFEELWTFIDSSEDPSSDEPDVTSSDLEQGLIQFFHAFSLRSDDERLQQPSSSSKRHSW